MEEAYESINWPIIFLIALLVPIGIAMEKTGTGEYLSIFADVKKSELLKFHKDTGMFESDEKFFKRAGSINSH